MFSGLQLATSSAIVHESLKLLAFAWFCLFLPEAGVVIWHK
jgi:hypothetical protein